MEGGIDGTVRWKGVWMGQSDGRGIDGTVRWKGVWMGVRWKGVWMEQSDGQVEDYG